MNIIFGTNDAEQLKEKYIVLELDTIAIRNSDPIVAARQKKFRNMAQCYTEGWWNCRQDDCRE